ncbi:ABC transporter permease [Anaeromyxobacter oryzisoli]|uniref:ABC transporter permease n=1 Tax=Anaeromyxobacter oryzisoli TaxID=2925408 RepID=UPI001F573A03|nr:ABC transporter permease [Anaeromyxobacter sp. SG63]
MRKRDALVGLAALAAFAGLWHLASTTGLFGRVPAAYAELLLPPPAAVARAAWESARTGELWGQVSVSLVRVAIGFGIAVAVGIPLGVVSAMSRAANAVLEPFVRLFSPIPGVAWVPLAILWFGLGDGAAIFIITIGSVFPVMLATAQGARAVDGRLVEAARTLGARTPALLRRVYLPSLVPFLVTGFRLGLGFAWRVVIAAEMVGVPKGIGYMLNMGRSTGRTEVTLLTMVMLGALMVVAEELVFAPLERHTRAWRAVEAA